MTTGDDANSDAPAVPLRQLVGALDTDAADEARERSRAWRELFGKESCSRPECASEDDVGLDE